MTTVEECLACFRIACQKCDWVASDPQVIDFLDGKIAECPCCGWAPHERGGLM